ncbi:MAG: hypothetical protein QF886_08190, partial [Planctomycetota bacterium]|nr:hypothetical protein [Planctomycetota bacterium]
MTRSIPVSRGEENMKGRRYLVTAWVKILRGRSASIQTGARAWRTPGSPGWQLMESVFDTEVRAPGSVDQPIPLSITADANSEVLVDDVRVAWIPAYGVHARFKVLQPEKGHFNGQAYVIRRHRDTAHRDVARHYFHSSVSSLAGEEGVPAGTFSDWFDVRRYLFGHGSSTVSIRVHPHHQDRTQPVKVILELSIGPVPVAKSSAGSGGQFELEEPDLDPEDEFEQKDVEEVEETDTTFFRLEHFSSNGRFAFFLPENDLPPSRFLKAVQSIDAEIVQRNGWAQKTLPAIERLPSRFPIGVNLSPMGLLIGPESIRAELSIL